MRFFERKFIVGILIASMLLPIIPAYSITENEWSEELDVSPQYVIDTFYMNEINGSQPCSGGSYNKWNRNVNATMANIADPANETNTIVRYISTANKTGELHKNVNMSPIPQDETIVISQDIMIPSSTENMKTDSVIVKLYGSEVLKLQYNASTNKFDGTFYNLTFTLAHNEWIRFHNIITPSGDGTNVTVNAQLSGNMINASGDDVFFMQTTANLSKTNSEYVFLLKGRDDLQGLAYFDNNCIMKAGDFGEATVTLDSFEKDYYRNFDLAGKVIVQLYHTMDLTTFNLSNVRLCNNLSEEIPCTSLKLAHDAQTLIFDFSQNKLPKYEDIYICFGDDVRDFYGNSMYEPTVIFETLGDYMEIPPPQDVIEVPAEGFVMPDQWNTGYRCDFSELTPLAEKYPEIVANSNVIDEKIARMYNFEFSYFTHNAHINITATSPIYIHDFYMTGGGIGNGKSGRPTRSSRVTIAWGEGDGCPGDFFGGADMTISHCYVHDVGADHMKGNSGQVVEFNYFRDGGTRNPGAHADVVQFMGDWSENKKAGMHAYFYGNRFDAPNMAYDHVANCCFFFKPEGSSAGYINVQAVGNWFNGGGYTTYLTPACDKSLTQQIYYNDNLWGYGYTFGAMRYDGEWVPEYNGSYENNGFMTTLQTGSVVYYNGVGENAKRVYSAEEMTAGRGTVMVNLANYLKSVRGYRIEVNVLDNEGNVVTSATKTGTVRKYTPVSEYMVDSNLMDTGLINPENGSAIKQLINPPDLPHDVPEYVELDNLPLDMVNYTIAVSVYDTTEGNQLIRTSNLGFEVWDCTRPTQSVTDAYYSVVFKDMDGSILSIQAVKQGENAIPPQAPNHEGFTFDGWSMDSHNVQTNLTITAMYRENKYYTVVFKDELGNILSTESVLQGSYAVAPDAPPKDGYTFIGWSDSYFDVYDNLEIFPLYEKIDTRSQELKTFSKALDAIEASQNESLAVRLVKIQEAYARWKFVDETEEGAYEAYTSFESLVLQYNADIEKINQTMQNGEAISQTTTKCPISY